jgi:hypothetical protein
MVTWVPLEEHAWLEPRAVTAERYARIAETIAKVASEEEPIFEGELEAARARTALLLAAIASYESHYAARVENCRVSNAGALGLWQTVAPRGQVCKSREGAARVALAMVRQSFQACSRHDELDRLAFYTDGFCRRDWRRSRSRVGRATRYWTKTPLKLPAEGAEVASARPADTVAQPQVTAPEGTR